jgi:hypothetical protein
MTPTPWILRVEQGSSLLVQKAEEVNLTIDVRNRQRGQWKCIHLRCDLIEDVREGGWMKVGDGGMSSIDAIKVHWPLILECNGGGIRILPICASWM